jgi:hypothetical protein
MIGEEQPPQAVGTSANVMVLGGHALPLVGRARVYSCGITPYDVTHLGHATTFVWVDVLSRVLHATGADVIVCRNVTDVDDALSAAADRAGEPYDRFAAVQQFYFEQDMAALRVSVPAIQPRAHAHVGEVVSLAAGLLARDAAYERGGSVYFRGGAAARKAVPDETGALRLSAEYGDDPEDPDRTTRSTWRSGGPRVRASPRGRARGERGGPAGTLNAPRSRCTRSDPLSTCRPAARTWSSRTTSARRRWPRRSPG